MASSLQFFDRELSVALTDLDPAAMQKELAAFARRSVADVIRSGEAPADYEVFVNGRQGAPEESVALPGPIVYVFSNWKLAIETAIEQLQQRVPSRTGRYAASFVVLANQQVVTDYKSIPPDGEVVIFNRQPYTRKMETGANKTGGRHFDRAKAAFNRRFPDVFTAQLVYLNVAGGVAPEVPYILKGSAGRRKDRQAGQPITYPALVINPA
jgi:hypothetical protein